MVLCRWVVLGLLLGVQRASPADLQQAQSPSKMQVISSPLIPMQSGSLACATASAPFCYTRDMYPGEFFLHMHLTKCGGTSLYSLFDQSNCAQPTYSFDKARRAAAESVAVAIDTDRAGRCGFYSFEFESLPRLLEGIAASSSLPAGLVSEAKAPVRLLTVIRRPILQIMSLYRHIRKYLKYAKCRSIADIVSERCKAFNFRNMQVTRLGDGLLEKAKKNIRSMFFVGIFEYYDSSLCLLAFQLGQLDAGKCSCSGEGRRSGHPLVPITMATNRSKNDYVTTSEVADLEDLIVLDNELYSYALKIFLERINFAEQSANVSLLCAPRRRDGEAVQLRALT